MIGEDGPLLEVTDLVKRFPPRHELGGVGGNATGGSVEAVAGVSFSVANGEVLGIVGESGSGKTTLARAVLRLTEPTSGSVRFQGRELSSMDRDELRLHVRPKMRMIFQHANATLNPGYDIGAALEKPMRLHGTVPESEIPGRVGRLLESVGLRASFAAKRPHELSGGEKRRVGICRALATRPDLIIADEPLSGLDVLLQERILELLLAEQNERGFGLVIISHDLERVNQVCDRVLVMYQGRLLEDVPIARRATAAREQFLHPYSTSLQQSRVDILKRAQHSGVPRSAERPTQPDALHDRSRGAPTGGCVFRTLCPRWPAVDHDAVCEREEPPSAQVGEGHRVACHFPRGPADGRA